MIAVEELFYTVEEYFAQEEKSEERHEYVNGEIIPMPGETTTANEIASNLLVFFKLFLKKKPFKVYEHDIKLMVKDRKIYRYPDLVVIHESGNHQKFVTDPVLIVEVLSAGTEDIDKEKKRVEYLSMPTLQYYLMVHQDEAIVEMYSRNEKGKWNFDFYVNIGETIELPFFATQISLETIYEGIM
ncbi:Uma2 family endonuclease [Arcicella aurantiaca]|uniref:Uma2 family endonuclease n=1 Tax=Arcicella aurantiaca TaxID=591202 RepID=A0A316EE03_9BACT|nr:Uma2 family endonuclease [Arcicella aurantiaca]PWK29226.1 Uma2 family endonuclease [Arcicella aurantiaca]